MSEQGSYLKRPTLRWRKLAPDDVEKELTQRSQFDSERVTLDEALVREAFQNILDAGRSGRGGPIRARIELKPPDPQKAAYLTELLGGLSEHLRASGVPVESGDLIQPAFLTIEDFETTGLTGEWRQRGPGGWNDFFRRFGASTKTGARGGRWGLGKLVFSSASRLRTFFAVTVRADDPLPQALLMGQTVLKTHAIDGVDYDSHGFFCSAGPDGVFQLPVTEQAAIAEFAAAAGVTRLSEPGLSVAIVAPLPGISIDNIIRYLLANYFFPILEGRLVVDVNGQDVSAATFDKLIQQYGDDVMRAGRLAGFIREMSVRRSAHPDAVACRGWVSMPDAGISSDALTELRSKFASGGLVHVRFPIRLRSRAGGEVDTYVDVLMRESRPDEKAASLCVRGLLTLPGEADRHMRLEGCFAALIADDDAIVSFLGDAEGPAHTDWNSREKRLSDNWLNSPQRLTEVRKAARSLHAVIAAAVQREEKDALIDEFSVIRPGAPQHRPQHETQRKLQVPETIRPKAKFRVSRCDRGFVVSAGPGLDDADLPLRIRVRVAYDTPRGNPFKHHSPLDFDLRDDDDIEIQSRRCMTQAAGANTAIVRAEERGFRVEFIGFDRNRDLICDARRVV